MDAGAAGIAVLVTNPTSPTSTGPTPPHIDSAENGFNQLWEEALARYKLETGHDLEQAPFAEELFKCTSVDEVARVLNDRKETVKAFRAHGHKIRAVLTPIVRIMKLFLDTGAEVAAAVSVFLVTVTINNVLIQVFFCRQTGVPGGKAIFVATGVLLQVSLSELSIGIKTALNIPILRN